MDCWRGGLGGEIRSVTVGGGARDFGSANRGKGGVLGGFGGATKGSIKGEHKKRKKSTLWAKTQGGKNSE